MCGRSDGAPARRRWRRSSACTPACSARTSPPRCGAASGTTPSPSPRTCGKRPVRQRGAEHRGGIAAARRTICAARPSRRSSGAADRDGDRTSTAAAGRASDQGARPHAHAPDRGRPRARAMARGSAPAARPPAGAPACARPADPSSPGRPAAAGTSPGATTWQSIPRPTK
jgi:hypothetical protein